MSAKIVGIVERGLRIRQLVGCDRKDGSKTMLPKDTTVLSLHAAGSAYHLGVLENLQTAVSEVLNPATAVVRVGLTGSGQSPNYRIESPELVEVHTITVRLPDAFRGPTHKEKSELDDLESHPENWSSNALTLSELQG